MTRIFDVPLYAYRRSPDQDAAKPARHPVVVIGAGPVGLALAIDLALNDVPVVVLDDNDKVSFGSRAICFAKRPLEILDRLGCGQPMVDKGVTWNVGKVFFGDRQVYEFNLLPQGGHKRPAFINLQQYYVEAYLAERAAALPLIDLRWQNKVVGVQQAAASSGAPSGEAVDLLIETPDGNYALQADWVIACDGSRSTVRQLIGQESHGRLFRDRFLIADVKMKVDFPAERWFWFDPDFHRNQSVLLHMQPDNVWRIDFQLGWDADREVEKRPENIIPRVRAMLDASPYKDAEFELEWASVYTFACQRMDAFRHGRVLFAGDSAHGVSPFGARGANSGLQDAENLSWKLAAVLRGDAGDDLLDTYACEREAAADENILNSTRSTDFITPKSETSRLFRDAVLHLARRHPFARGLVNSGRLSVPATLDGSPLNTADRDTFGGLLRPGAVAADAPYGPITERRGERSGDGGDRPGWLLRSLGTSRFIALLFGSGEAASDSLQALAEADRPFDIVRVPIDEAHALAVERYDAQPGTVYLLRPDQHVCARWRKPDSEAVQRAYDRAHGRAATGSAA